MNHYNLISYFNDAFGVDPADAVDLSAAVEQLDNDEHLVPEYSEYFDNLTWDHVLHNRDLVMH